MVCLTSTRNFSAPFGGISVDFAYMDQIVQFNQEDMDVVVQPSIGWQDLNEQLSKMGSGLFFPVDPGESFLRSRNWSAVFLGNEPGSTVPGRAMPRHAT